MRICDGSNAAPARRVQTFGELKQHDVFKWHPDATAPRLRKDLFVAKSSADSYTYLEGEGRTSSTVRTRTDGVANFPVITYPDACLSPGAPVETVEA